MIASTKPPSSCFRKLPPVGDWTNVIKLPGNINTARVSYIPLALDKVFL